VRADEHVLHIHVVEHDVDHTVPHDHLDDIDHDAHHVDHEAHLVDDHADDQADHVDNHAALLDHHPGVEHDAVRSAPIRWRRHLVPVGGRSGRGRRVRW